MSSSERDTNSPMADSHAPGAHEPSEPWGTAPTSAQGAGAEMHDDADIVPPSAAEREATSSRRSGGGTAKLVFVVVVILAAAGALAYYQPWKQFLETTAEPETADPMAEMNASLEGLEAMQARLRQQVEALAPRVDALERATAQLQESINALPAEEASNAQQVSQELLDRVSRLESQSANAISLAQQVRSLEGSVAVARDTAGKLAATVLAVGQLTQAASGSGPFVRPLAVVRGLGGDDPAMAQAAASLEKYAATGVPTVSMLRSVFPQMANAVVKATPVVVGEDWSDRVLNQIASLVSVRKTGDAALAGGGVDGTLARAKNALMAGDLQTAVTAIESLPAPSAAPAASWLQQAHARLEVDQALASLEQQAISRLKPVEG